VFTSKSAEFREAIAAILGVKLAFYPNGQVRVTSIYDLCASFVFQPTTPAAVASGASVRMQLVAQGEGGPPEIPQLMRYWIEEEECLPGFLASVTMECYDKAKREGTLNTAVVK
jgi:mitotic spindle assembly checkpoint protein MAD1